MIRKRIIYTDFSDWQFDITKAEGSYLWDSGGKKYIDFTSAWNVTNLGWNHPEIVTALVRQAKKNTTSAMWMADTIQVGYAALLTRSLPDGLEVVSKTTGGMEANEEAIKLARSYTGRKKILGFATSYHGQSIACLTLSYLPEWFDRINDQREYLLQIPFPDTYRTTKRDAELLAELEASLDEILSREDVAAVLTESGVITGWGSTMVAPNGFLSLIRKKTKQYGTLLILDEVGSGFSRLGKLFAMEVEGVVPDIVTLAKGISNGAAPIGALVTTKRIATEGYAAANLQSTFGWLPISCAAAKATLGIHLRDKVWKKAEKDGAYMLSALRREIGDQPHVGDVRGRGMEIGVDFVKDKASKEKYTNYAERIVQEARKKGLHVVWDKESVIQLMPPLTIERDVLDKGIEVLVDVIQSLASM